MLLPSQITVVKKNTFTGHSAGVFSLGDGETANSFISGAGDGIAALWDIDGKDSAKGLAQITSSIFALYLNAKNNHLYAGTLDGGIHITDLIQKAEVHKFSPDGNIIYAITPIQNHQIAIGSGSGKVYIWDANKNILVHSIQVSKNSIRSIIYSALSNEIVMSCSDFNLYVYDASTFSLKYTLIGHTNSVFCCAFGKGERFLVSGSRDAQLIVWDAENQYQKAKSIPAHMFTVNDIKFSPDGRLFATAGRDKHIKIWDAATHNLLKVIDKEKYEGHINSVNKLFWSNWNNSLISCGDDRSIMVWGIEITETGQN